MLMSTDRVQDVSSNTNRHLDNTHDRSFAASRWPGPVSHSQKLQSEGVKPSHFPLL